MLFSITLAHACLLEGVHLEALEAEDVEDADEELHIFDVALLLL